MRFVGFALNQTEVVGAWGATCTHYPHGRANGWVLRGLCDWRFSDGGQRGGVCQKRVKLGGSGGIGRAYTNRITLPTGRMLCGEGAAHSSVFGW